MIDAPLASPCAAGCGSTVRRGDPGAVVYLAGGDPEHLLTAYQTALEEGQRLGYLDTEGKLRTPLLKGDRVILVGSPSWMPLLNQVALEYGARVCGESILLPETEYTIPPPGSGRPNRVLGGGERAER